MTLSDVLATKCSLTSRPGTRKFVDFFYSPHAFVFGRLVLFDLSLYISSPLHVEDASKMEKWYGMAKRYWIRCRSLMVAHLSTCFYFRLSIYARAFWYSGSCISRFFNFAYLRHTNKQDGAKEESSLDNKMYIRVRQ